MSTQTFHAGPRELNEQEARAHVAAYFSGCGAHRAELFSLNGVTVTGAEAARRSAFCSTSELAELWETARQHAHRRGEVGIRAWISPERRLLALAAVGNKPNAAAIYAERNKAHDASVRSSA